MTRGRDIESKGRKEIRGGTHFLMCVSLSNHDNFNIPISLNFCDILEKYDPHEKEKY